MKIIDQFYTCKMPGPGSCTWQLHCHLRIFRARTNVHTVMIADTGFEIGWFNPDVIERLVNQVVHEFELDPAKLVWLEYYPSNDRTSTPAYRTSTPTFSQVAFEWQNGKATNPQWLSIAPEVAQALISEDLVLLTDKALRSDSAFWSQSRRMTN
ncbi:MAG: hypothetical protein ACAF41_14490 [Leptolyngbya sp. BL-A-14]